MKIMYLTRELSVGGVTKCIYNLCKNRDSVPIVCSHGGELKKNFINLGINHYDIPNVEERNIWVLIYTIGKIRKIAKKENVSIIHSHHRMASFLAKIAVIGTRIQVIHTQHLNIQNKYMLTGFALRGLPIITVSIAAKDILVNKSKLDGRYIETIYNTIDYETSFGYADSKIIKEKENYFIVAQVSRLVDYKGVYELISIASEVSKENSNIKFFLIGDGPEKENILKKIQELELNDTLFLLGNKENILKQLEFVDLMILCSLVEGLPLAPLEAFYSGIPVIGSDIEGTKEEIEHNMNGYLIPQKEVKEFAEKIMFLFNNQTIFSNMKKEAKKTFQNKFTRKKYVEEHNEFYKKVLRNKERIRI